MLNFWGPSSPSMDSVPRRQGPPGASSESGGVLAAIGSLVTLAIGFAIVMGLASLIQSFQLIEVLSPSRAAPVVLKILTGAGIAVFCWLAGYCLFAIRQKRRRFYALLELGSASAFAIEAWFRTPGESYHLTVLAALLGAVYVAVRGFDNLSQSKAALKK